MTPPTHITLIGFMASGKSTVARLLAERLGGLPLASDDLIEAQTVKTIAFNHFWRRAARTSLN